MSPTVQHRPTVNARARPCRCTQAAAVGRRIPVRSPPRAVAAKADSSADKEQAQAAAKAGPPPPPEPSPDSDARAVTTPRITSSWCSALLTSCTASQTRSEAEGATDAGEAAEEQKAACERLVALLEEQELPEALELAKSVKNEESALVGAAEAADAQAKDAKAKLEQLKDQYRRLQADFDNFRSRADNEKAQTGKNVKMSVIEDLLPLIDNFELAAGQLKPQTEAEEKINASYQGLYRQMVDIFRGMGLEAVPTKGAVFDPEMHDGVMKEETADAPDNTVLEEFRKGFMFSGKLLRPAMVKVAVNSSGGGASEGEAAAASGSEGSDAAAP